MSLGVDMHVCEVVGLRARPASAKQSTPLLTCASIPVPPAAHSLINPLNAFALTLPRPKQVQLILLDFAKLRTAEGHARYVQARNRRGV